MTTLIREGKRASCLSAPIPERGRVISFEPAAGPDYPDA
jgi:hypothetical protein